MIYFIISASIVTLAFILGFFKNKWIQIAAETLAWLGTLSVLWIVYDLMQALLYIIQMLAGRVI